jgi:hypothetical protein
MSITGGAEALIRRLVASHHGASPRSVWCPARVVAKRGTSFDCRFVSASGGAGTITEHVESNAGRLSVGLDEVQVTATSLGLAPGTPVRFHNIPGLRPRVALVLVAGQPVDPGWGEGGPAYASVPAGLVWPSPGAVGLVRVRFVTVAVTIINVGRAPLQMRLAGAATDEQGREAGEVNREDSAWPGPYGRGPDWTSRLSPPIRRSTASASRICPCGPRRPAASGAAGGRRRPGLTTWCRTADT